MSHVEAGIASSQSGRRRGNATTGVVVFFLLACLIPIAPASTLWTEAKVDYGLVGVVILFLLLGGVVSRIDQQFVRSGLRSAAGYVIPPLLAPYYIVLLRGSFAATVGIISPLLLLLVTAVRMGGTEHSQLGRITGPRPAASPRSKTQGG